MTECEMLTGRADERYLKSLGLISRYLIKSLWREVAKKRDVNKMH